MRTGSLQLLLGSQVSNFRPEVLVTDPTVGTLVAGQTAVFWYNSTDAAYKYFDGTAIKVLGGDAVLPEGLIKADGTVAMTADLVLSSTDQGESADAAAISKAYAQSLIGEKQDKLTGLTDGAVLVAGPGNTVVGSTTVTATELGYLDGVTSSVQTQLDSKLNANGGSLLSALDAGTFKITNLGAPTVGTDAARKIDIENALAGLNWQEDVNAVQIDNTLVPVAVTGNRYVLTDTANLNAGFGTIAGVADNCIVEYDGTEFQVVFSPSAPRAEGAIAWNAATDQYVRFDGTVWSTFGGMASVTAGVGLVLSGNELSVQVDTAGAVEVNGSNELRVKLDGSSLGRATAGLSIADGGVTYGKIDTAAIGTGLKKDATTSTLQVDFAAVKTAGFIDATGGSVAALTLTGEDPLVDASVVSKKYVDDAITAGGGGTGTAKTYIYDQTAEAAATTFLFTHNAGTKFGAVTVYDDTGYQVIPDEVVLVDANSLRVEITAAKKLAIVFVTDPAAV